MSTDTIKMDVTVRMNEKGQSKIRAYATVVLDRLIRIRGIKVIEGPQGLFIGYPNFKNPQGKFLEFVVPENREIRNIIQQRVLQSFADEKAKRNAA